MELIRVEYKGFVGFFETRDEIISWKKEIDESEG